MRTIYFTLALIWRIGVFVDQRSTKFKHHNGGRVDLFSYCHTFRAIHGKLGNYMSWGSRSQYTASTTMEKLLPCQPKFTTITTTILSSAWDRRCVCPCLSGAPGSAPPFVSSSSHRRCGCPFLSSSPRTAPPFLSSSSHRRCGCPFLSGAPGTAPPFLRSSHVISSRQ